MRRVLSLLIFMNFRMGAWFPLFAWVVFFQSSAFACNGKLILGATSEPLVLSPIDELSFRARIVDNLAVLAQTQTDLFTRVNGWYKVCQATRDERGPTAAETALRQAIETTLSGFKSEKHDENVLLYFGSHYTGISARRLHHLEAVFLIQDYLARFNLRLMERLASRLPPEINLLAAPPELVNEIAAEVEQALANPVLQEDYHLKQLKRVSPRRTFGLIGASSELESDYARADQLALEAALAKCRAYARDAGVPDGVSSYLKLYLLDLETNPIVRPHPILIEWMEHLEKFLTPDHSSD